MIDNLISLLRNGNKVKCTLFGKIRLLLGICFNIWLLYIFCKELLNDGIYDEQWEYYYKLIPQYLIIVSCCCSLIVDCMLFRTKNEVLLYVLITSNLIFWFSFLGLFSNDPKTHISYGRLGMIIAAIIGFIMSFAQVVLFRCIYKNPQTIENE